MNISKQCFLKHFQCLDAIIKYLLRNIRQETCKRKVNCVLDSEVIFSQYWRFSIFGDLRIEFLMSIFLNIHVLFPFTRARGEGFSAKFRAGVCRPQFQNGTVG